MDRQVVTGRQQSGKQDGILRIGMSVLAFESADTKISSAWRTTSTAVAEARGLARSRRSRIIFSHCIGVGIMICLVVSGGR